jgi:hypothetical protein
MSRLGMFRHRNKKIVQKQFVRQVFLNLMSHILGRRKKTWLAVVWSLRRHVWHVWHVCQLDAPILNSEAEWSQFAFQLDCLEKRFFAFSSQWPPMHTTTKKARAQGCQISLVHDTTTGKNEPNNHKMVIEFPQCPSNIPNGHKIYQHFPT